VTAEALVRVGGPLGAVGLAVLVLAPGRLPRLAGLLAWAMGSACFLPYVLPDVRVVFLAGLAVGGLALAACLAALFVRWPWAVAFLALAAIPVRIPVTVGNESANLLLPLYVVVAGAALALGWRLWRAPPGCRELGPIAWPLAALVSWFGIASLWSDDLRGAVITLFFFVLPFGLLAAIVARLPWRERAPAGLSALLLLLAVVFAGIGIGQWAARDIFWNPKVIVGNVYAPFYRVNSVFWDPSIYGRFLVVAILVALVLLLFSTSRPVGFVLAAVIVVLWAGMFFSFSQSSFVALFVGVTLTAVLAWRWRAVAAVALVAAVMVPVGVAAPQLASVRQNVVSASTDGLDRATSGRYKLITNGIRIALDHPLVGVGTGGFKKAYAERLGLRQSAPAVASHNTPVTVSAETGVIGLLLFTWLLAAGLLVALRRNDGAGVAQLTGLAAGVVLVAVLVHSFFYNAFFEDATTWMALGLAALAVDARKGATT
jgi:putative inorganic carbon (HCO3(-)) transporter